MRYFIATLVLVLMSGMLFSQDVIRKTDGTEIICKIVEATRSEVKFKVEGSNDVTSLATDDIKEIQFSNGVVNTYETKSVKYDYELTKHMVSLEPIDLIAFITLHLGYQYQANKKLAIYVPFKYKLNGDYFSLSADFRYALNNSEISKIYIGNLDMGDGYIDYFVGPSLMFTSYNKAYTSSNIKMNYSHIKVTAGVSLQQVWGLNATFFFGFGPGYDFANSNSDFDWNVNLAFGYRFNKKTVKS